MNGTCLDSFRLPLRRSAVFLLRGFLKVVPFAIALPFFYADGKILEKRSKGKRSSNRVKVSEPNTPASEVHEKFRDL